MSDSVDTTVDTTSSRERIKRALSHGKKGRINKDLSNKIMLGVFRAAAYITTLVLVAIIAYVVINGLPHISLDFIFGWPQGVNAEGGIWPTIVSTVYVTALAMLICTPIAVLAAVYLAEYAKQGKVVELIRYAADACFLRPLAALPRASSLPSAVPSARPPWCSTPWARPSIYLFRRSIPVVP